MPVYEEHYSFRQLLAGVPLLILTQTFRYFDRCGCQHFLVHGVLRLRGSCDVARDFTGEAQIAQYAKKESIYCAGTEMQYWGGPSADPKMLPWAARSSRIASGVT